jgi:hypothetical protein
MKKKIEKLRLRLTRESIRQLTAAESNLIVGGIKRTFTPFTGCNTISQVDESCCGC